MNFEGRSDHSGKIFFGDKTATEFVHAIIASNDREDRSREMAADKIILAYCVLIGVYFISCFNGFLKS